MALRATDHADPLTAGESLRGTWFDKYRTHQPRSEGDRSCRPIGFLFESRVSANCQSD